MAKKKVIMAKKVKAKPVPRVVKQIPVKAVQGQNMVSKPMQASLSVTTNPAPIVTKPEKPEPKNKLVLEYIIYASPKLLFEFITTPSGLSEWFADDVNIKGTVYTFVWEGAKQQADVINITEGRSIRLRWTDRPSDTYFEFRIEKNDLTQELSLIITDFAESAEDKNSLEALWQGQVHRLMKVIGSKV